MADAADETESPGVRPELSHGLQPAEFWYARGDALADARDFEQAIASYDRAIAFEPGHARAYARRGIALAASRRRAEALASCLTATTLGPSIAQVWIDLARILDQLRSHDLAAKACAKALSVAPERPFLKGRLLQQKLLACDWSGLQALIDDIESEVAKGERAVHPFCWQAVSSSPRNLRLAAARFDQRGRATSFPISPRTSGADKVRIGYVSGEFRDRPTGILMAGVLEQHDRTRFEVLGFDNGWDDGSLVRRRLCNAFDRLTDIRGLGDDEAVSQIRDSQIDILVNLNGYFGEHRNGVFSRRAAPIQASYLGFPGTMGVDYIDYLIADPVVAPASHRAFFSEKIVWLPGSYQATDNRRPIAGSPASRAQQGLPARGFVFACFNSSYKILPHTLDLWAGILQQVDGSVLWLLDDTPAATANLRREAAARGVDAARLIFAARLPGPEHLARHRCADLFLDTLPCGAHTTASDALWSGLPVLTCLGETFPGRVAASLLGAMELSELVAPTPGAYARLAVELAQQPARLEALRRKLQDNRLTTPLFDTPRFTRRLEAAFIAMHNRSIAGLPPDHIDIPNA